MKNILKFQGIMLISFLFMSQLFAQPGRGLNQSNMTRLYNSATVDTITGIIKNVDVVNSGYGRFPGTLLTLKDTKPTVKILIAPVWYLTDLNVQIKKDEAIKIIGSRVTYLNEQLIITKEMLYKNETYTIRNESGIPVWAGRRMGPGRGRRGRR